MPCALKSYLAGVMRIDSKIAKEPVSLFQHFQYHSVYSTLKEFTFSCTMSEKRTDAMIQNVGGCHYITVQTLKKNSIRKEVTA